MIQYVTLFVCAGLTGVLIYRYDLYEKEPPGMVLLALGVGAAMMWLIGSVEDQTVMLWANASQSALWLAAVMATHEELAKVLGVWLIAVVARRHFNDPMDGLIYGSLIGLGAAAVESVFYLGFAYPGSAALLPPGEVVRVVGHPVMGGMGGYAVGMWRLKMAPEKWRAGLALAAAIGLHFLWDWLAYQARVEGANPAWIATGGVALMLVGFLIYGWLIIKASHMSRQVFAPESARSVWGWPFRKQ